MADDYTEYLAVNVLNELLVVNYRMLSRALKVHSNLAKQMLFEFHRKQNGKKPGQVHATYVVTGLKSPPQPVQVNGAHAVEREDTIMQSSPPFPGSSAPKIEEEAETGMPFRCVMLVREEDLEQARGAFESVTGIHVYSLQSQRLSDLQALTECNHKVLAGYASEDPMHAWKQYGTIQNPNVRRRTPKRPLLTATPMTEDIKAKTKLPSKPPASIEKQTSKDSQDFRPASRAGSAKGAPEPEKAKPTKPAATERQNSDIFKSFAKAKPPLKRTTTESSAEATPASAEPAEEPNGPSSDDEPADEDLAMADAADVLVPPGKSKHERKADLQAMMDVDDELEDDAPASTVEGQADADGAIDQAQPSAEAEKDEVTVEGGRRRGRRRLMKKKTVKDEDGYLVTKEEAAWESFSEDEPVAKKLKMPSNNAANKSATVKKGGRPGQGNIMSFFGKK